MNAREPKVLIVCRFESDEGARRTLAKVFPDADLNSLPDLAEICGPKYEGENEEVCTVCGEGILVGPHQTAALEMDHAVGGDAALLCMLCAIAWQRMVEEEGGSATVQHLGNENTI